MSYALVQGGAVAAYPYSFAALRQANPHVSFPRNPSDERLAAFGVHRVVPSAKPAHDAITENVVEATPALVDGVWTQAWSVVPASAEQIAARQQRVADEAAKAEAKGDAFVQTFVGMTPAEVVAYVNANTGSLAETRALLKKMAVMLLILARRELR